MNETIIQDFTNVTELPKSWLTEEQYKRLHHRYKFAGELGKEKKVLDVGCGAGLGVSYLAKQATFLAAGDYTEPVVQLAKHYYKTSIPLLCFDGEAIPFAAGSFDLLCNFEAICYFPQPERFITECVRVLKQNGSLLIGLENQDWAHFVAGPQSVQYFSIPILSQLLLTNGFKSVECFGILTVTTQNVISKIRATLRQWITQSGILANRFYDVRERLKPLVYQQMYEIQKVNEFGLVNLPSVAKIVSDQPNQDFKVIYWLASK